MRNSQRKPLAQAGRRSSHTRLQIVFVPSLLAVLGVAILGQAGRRALSTNTGGVLVAVVAIPIPRRRVWCCWLTTR